MAYYITGDCHGNFDKIKLFCDIYKPRTDDVLIVLGDFGINFWLDRRDIEKKEELAKLPLTIFAIHGNHEARPFELDGYKEKEWMGGIVYEEDTYPKIKFAKDGEMYILNDKKCIVIGGAYSIDKDYRLMAGLPWYESEQPTTAIKQYVEIQLKKMNWKVDYVFSHTCPIAYEPTDLFLDYIDSNKVDKSTEEWLSAIERKLIYEKWYFGHFHDNREYNQGELLYEKIKELGTNRTMICVGRPKYKNGEFVSFDFNAGKGVIEQYGMIKSIDAYGTIIKKNEVSYDIVDADGILRKHIPESKVYRLKSIVE